MASFGGETPVSFTNLSGTNIAPGLNPHTIYTCPAGKYAYYSIVKGGSNVGSIDIVAGGYASTLPDISPITANGEPTIVRLGAGDSIRINKTSGGPGYDLSSNVLEYNIP